MRTPAVAIFVVCVLIIGFALAFRNCKEEGLFTESPNISKSQADSLKRFKEGGDEDFYQQNYEEAIRKYKQALRIWPADAHLQNDLGASYYRLGLARMVPPMDEGEFDFGVEVDARVEGSEPLKRVKEKLETTESGVVTAVVNGEPDKDEIETYALSLGHYVHVEEEDVDEDEKEFWVTIITGETKDAFLNAEKEYLKSINIKYVKDSSGRRYSNYATVSRNLGTLYFRIGRKKEAISQWRRAMELEPSDAELRELLDKYEDDE